MKKQFKTKLVLNSQTIRRLPARGLQQVQGGVIPVRTPDDDPPPPPPPPPTAYCRACG